MRTFVALCLSRSGADERHGETRPRVAEVARLVSRPELVKLSHRTALPSHRTLKATFDWSYDLPPDAERMVFRRIAPFVGHFTLEARGMPQANSTQAPATYLTRSPA